MPKVYSSAPVSVKFNFPTGDSIVINGGAGVKDPKTGVVSPYKVTEISDAEQSALLKHQLYKDFEATGYMSIHTSSLEKDKGQETTKSIAAASPYPIKVSGKK